MGWAWNPITLGAWISGSLTFALAAFVYAAAPRNAANRFLSLALACEALLQVLNYGLMYSLTDAADAYASQIAGFVAFALSLLFYVLFLGTLRTPWTRPLGSRAGRWVVAVAGASLAVTQVVADHWVFVGVYAVSYAPWEGMPGTGFYWMVGISLLVAALGLVASVSAFRRAKGTLSRAKARAYVVAFSIHDFALVFQAVGWAALVAVLGSADLVARVLVVAQPVLGTLFVAVLAYGILKTQLFDIDLKIKWTLRRGTVAGAFLAVFLVASVTAENFLTNRYGWAVGGVTAGLLLFVIAPLQRGADRLAERAMPGVNDTSEYEAFRKLSVYRAAVESAYEVGGVSTKERSILERMRQKLGVLPGDAGRIEAEFGAIRAR